MRSRRSSRARIVALAAMLVGPSAAGAQDIEVTCGRPSAVDMNDPALAPGSPLVRLHPDTARARLAAVVAAGEWPQAVDSLRSWLAATRVADAAPARTRTLDRRLDTLAAALAAPGTVDGVLAAEAPILDFSVTIEFPNGYAVFPSEPYRFLVRPADPPGVQRALCWTALSAADLLGRFRAPELDVLRRRIRRALAQWSAYNDSGRSQYPWELWLNGFRGDPLALAPPRWQWIVFHPWIGVEAAGLADARLDDLGSVTRGTVVPLDLIGVIRYDESYTRYRGLSAALALGEDATRGALVLHLSNGVSLGPTWGRVGWPDGALFSVDFYYLLAGLPHAQRAVEERLRSAVAPTPDP